MQPLKCTLGPKRKQQAAGTRFVLIVRGVKFNILVTIRVARFPAVANGAAYPIRYRVKKSFSFLTGEW
ncbi:MAG TPA: hypothetical protein VI037_08100 [Nitrososphaera sp.]